MQPYRTMARTITHPEDTADAVLELKGLLKAMDDGDAWMVRCRFGRHLEANEEAPVATTLEDGQAGWEF